MNPPPRAILPPRAAAALRGWPSAQVCQGGVLLRTLLLVHAVLALGLLGGSRDLADWSLRLSLAVLAVLPATLIWLAGLCAGWERLRAWPEGLRWLAQAGWGAACGLGAAAVARTVERALATGLPEPLALPALLAWPVGAAALALAVGYWLLLRERLRVPAATQARLAELQSRIRPHFLFNALNSAIALVRVDPERAEGVLEDLAELFRAALVSGGDQVSLGQEIELARRYLAIEQVRFGDRLRVQWALEPAAEPASVPSLLLQPLVENAVRHGVEPAPEGGELLIRTQVHRGQALVSITNTVPAGPARAGGHGIALRNVRERLALLHDVTMRFEAGPVEGGRYRVRIAVPLVAQRAG
ncbi:MAG: histidine kinase [Burkholderiaceae bacterium]|nr:histidine kinase [Burkholderiaceae bacterium]